MILYMQPTYGQGNVTTASLTGTVADSTGARIPNAKIVLSSVEVGVTRQFLSDSSGSYTMVLVTPGAYSLVVEATGFKTYRQSGLVLHASQAAEQDVILSVGAQADEVVVTSQVPLLNTSNANVGAEIDSQQVVSLPLNLRNIFGLATLNSSVNNSSQPQALGSAGTTGSADQDISFANFGGGFFGTTTYLLDGIWDTAGGDWGEPIYVPSVDAVDEFKVQNNSFTAEYGWGSGNAINVVTKSGTSNFHGSAYEFYRNSVMDANLYFANASGRARPPFTRNQYGLSMGGPLYIPKLYPQRNKTYLFGLYEKLHSATPLVGTYTVPSASFKQGNFSALLGAQVGTDNLGRPVQQGQIYNPTSTRLVTAGQTDPITGLAATKTGYVRDPIPGNIITSVGSIDPVAAKIISYYPAPTESGLVNNFVGSAVDPSASDEYFARVDHNFSDSSRLFFRYAYKSEYKTQTPAYWGATNSGGPGGKNPNNRYGLAAGFSHVFTPTLTLNLSAGFESNGEGGYGQGFGFHPSQLGFPSYLDSITPVFPNITVGSQSSLAPNGATLSIRPNGSYSVDLVKTIQRHTLSIGYMGVVSQYHQGTVAQTALTFNGSFTQGPDPDNPTGNTGNGLAEMELGFLDSGTTGAHFSPASSKYYYGEYLQDDFKVNRTLTLNLGGRYDIQTPPVFRHNAAAYFDPNAPNPLGSALGSGQTLPGVLVYATSGHRGTYSPTYTNFSPRLGFSDQLLSKLVARGGYAIEFPASAMLNGATSDGYQATTSVAASLDSGHTPNPAVTLANPWPSGLRAVTGNTLGGLEDVGNSVNTLFWKRPSAYLQQWMVGLQYAFTPNDVLDVGYIGEHGIHMPSGGQTGASLSHSQLDPKYLSMGAAALNALVPNPYAAAIGNVNSPCGLDQPKVAQAQLLRPFPQYCSVSENDSLPGFTLYDALQVSYNHRFEHGLTVFVSYTFSKFLDNVEGAQSWAYVGYTSPANLYNLAAEKSVDGDDIPQSLVINYVYSLPIGRGKAVGANLNRVTDAVVGGWQVSGVSSFKSGLPLNISGNNIASFGGNPRPILKGNPKLSHRTIHEWLDTSAIAYAPYGTFGTVPRYFSNLRGPGYQDWDIAILKNWTFPKEMKFQFRAEMFNAFNRANFFAPSGSYDGCDPNAASNCASSFGTITNTFPARDVQLAGKFYW
jgi:hypothetical protein